jgi:hypothetical protein
MTVLESVMGFLTFALGGASGWFATAFVASPIRRFFDLRGEVIEKANRYANVQARAKQAVDGTYVPTPELSGEQEKRLQEAEAALRDLASRMRAFAENERLAVRILKWLRHDPARASAALFGVSNSIGTYGSNRKDQRDALGQALRVSLDG